ncbi:MAG: hypothetical protein ACRENU_08860 [Gemmatimonadaceae bacterium]
MSSSRTTTLVATFALSLGPLSAAAAQSNVTVSPFVSYVPSATSNPLAGFSLTFGGTTGLALRSSAEISISKPDSTIVGHYRPWGADADAMLFLGGLGGGATVFSRSLSPYVFTGIGLTGGDSAGRNHVTQGWSYGLGAAIPLGLDADLFAEARWRMDKYVLPTADGAPDSKSALRFGLSFHVGGGSPEPQRRYPPRRRMDEYEDEEYVVVPAAPQVVQQAPAPQVVVVQPAAPPPASVVIVQPDPEPSTTVNVNLPGSVVHSSRSRRSNRVYVQGSECSRVSSRRSRCTSGTYSYELRTPRQTATNVIQMRARAPSVATTTRATTVNARRVIKVPKSNSRKRSP